MKKIRTSVSGLGRIGWQFHLPSLAAHEGFITVAVCDPLEERRAEARDVFAVPAAYDNFKQMLDAEQPDLVVVCSPTHFHEPQAILAMESGCDVFLDKPMAPDLAAADRIIAAKQRTGRKLMMYQPYRAQGETLVLQDILRSGVLGEIYMMKFRNSNYVHRNDWQAFRKFGGGMLNNFGAHAIDQAMLLAGSAAKKVSGSLYCAASAGDADDVVKLLVRTESNVTLDIEINMASAYPEAEPRIMAYGRRGTAMLSVRGGELFYDARYYDPSEQPGVVASDFLAAADRKYITAAPAVWHEKTYPLKDTNINYYDKCYEYYGLGNPPFVDVAETREVMRVIAECRESSGFPQQ